MRGDDIVGGVFADRHIVIRRLGNLEQQRLHRRLGGLGEFFRSFTRSLHNAHTGDDGLLFDRIFGLADQL